MRPGFLTLTALALLLALTACAPSARSPAPAPNGTRSTDHPDHGMHDGSHM